MLNMITNVQIGDIEGSIIRVGVLSHNELVMLSNNVHGDRVQTKSKNSAHKQIYQSFSSEMIEDEGIPREDNDHVNKFHSIRVLLADNIWSNSVEERHKEDIHELSEWGGEEANFPLSRKIGIPIGSSEEDVMISMVSSEGNRAGESLAHIGKDSSELIMLSGLEGSVMGQIVDQDV